MTTQFTSIYNKFSKIFNRWDLVQVKGAKTTGRKGIVLQVIKDILNFDFWNFEVFDDMSYLELLWRFAYIISVPVSAEIINNLTPLISANSKWLV